MSDSERQLFGLMEITERHQAAVQTALEGLVVERIALQREREQFARDWRALEIGLQVAAELAIERGLGRATLAGVEAVQAAAEPLLGRLDKVSEGAGQAEAALQQVVRWASWRLLGWGMAGVAGVVLIGWLASLAILWWDMGEIGKIQAQKASLQAEVAQLQATQDKWKEAGMLGRFTHCNPGHRPCIQVDEHAGAFGDQSDYRVILGY